MIVVFPEHTHYFCIYLDGKESAGGFALVVLCLVTVHVLWLFLTVPWVGLQFVIVAFPDHSHFLFRSVLSLSIGSGFRSDYSLSSSL